MVELEKGQATVEGAFLIPILLLCLVLLMQPSIILYDRMVMQAAAAEGCRLLVTADFDEISASSFEAFVKNRLSGIPQQDNFHVHAGGCSYEIRFSGDESSERVSVSISQKIKLLPFSNAAAQALGIADGSGCYELKVESSLTAKDSWVVSNEKGLNPDSWVTQWDD